MNGYHINNYKTKNSRFRKILQYDLNNNYIAEYSTIAEAARAVNGDPKFIRNYLTGILKQSPYGYIWKYKQEE